MNVEEMQREAVRALDIAAPIFGTLSRLATAEYATLLPLITPRDGDLRLAFIEEVAEHLAPLYAAMWGSPPLALGVARDQTQLRATAATVELLRDGHPATEGFPGGYRRMAPALAPGRVWVAWKYVRPGASSGMSFDGLVFLDDHWAWFPKPWRGLRLPKDPDAA